MKLKIILITVVLIVIILLAIFGIEIKEKAIRAIAKEVPDYYCGKDEICTTCIIEGQKCSCGERVCECGNRTVKKEECEFVKNHHHRWVA